MPVRDNIIRIQSVRRTRELELAGEARSVGKHAALFSAHCLIEHERTLLAAQLVIAGHVAPAEMRRICRIKLNEKASLIGNPACRGERHGIGRNEFDGDLRGADEILHRPGVRVVTVWLRRGAKRKHADRQNGGNARTSHDVLLGKRERRPVVTLDFVWLGEQRPHRWGRRSLLPLAA